MAQKFRKKPVVIEAVQWTNLGTNLQDIKEFMGASVPQSASKLLINTLEGQMSASLGDWIIKGVSGEFYPCKPAIFEQTYEPVDG